MSAISTYLHQIITAIWAKDVRRAIHDAISQCYDDVNAPALQTEAMQAAVQAKIDAGQMAALTIADGSLTGAKLADGTIPTEKIADGAITAGKIASGVIPAVDTTLTQSGSAADARAVRDAIASIEPGLSDEAKAALLACFEHVAWIDNRGQACYAELETALNGVDYYNIKYRSISNGYISYRQGGIRAASYGFDLIKYTSEYPRLHIMCDKGKRPCGKGNTSYTDEELANIYPVPVPIGTTQITFTASPNTFYVSVGYGKFNGSTYEDAGILSSGFQPMPYTATIPETTELLFMGVALEYAGDGTHQLDRLNEFEILFS